MSNDKLRVDLIQIRNVLGVESAEFRPGNVTVVSGRSNTGKTSVLEAIKAAIGGGKDATLLRHGEAEGSVVLVLENGTTITRKITEGGSSLAVKAPGMGRLGAGQGFLDDLIIRDSFNPVEFIDAPAKRRVEMLLRALPHEAKVDVAQKLGGKPNDDVLELLAAAHKRVYDQRTEENRVQRESTATAEQIRHSLPPAEEMDTDWVLKVKAREQKLVQDQEEMAQQEGMSRQSLEAAKATATKQHQHAVCEIDAAMEARIATVRQEKEALQKQAEEARAHVVELERQVNGKQVEINAEIDNQRKQEDACKLELRRLMEASEKEYVEKLRTVKAEYGGRLNAARVEIQAIRAQERSVALALQQREFARDMERKAADAAKKSDALTGKLEEIATMKEGLLSRLPIAGLQMNDGEVLVGGIPFDRLSDSQRIEFAVSVAVLCPGRLGLVCVDGLEKLDSARFEAFCAEVGKYKIQVIGTRVDDGALRVEVNGQPVGAVKGGEAPQGQARHWDV